MAKASPSNAGGAGLIPAQEAKIPHASWQKDQNIKQNQYCNKISKDFLNFLKKKSVIINRDYLIINSM